MTNAVRPFLNAEENKTRLKLMTKKMRLKDDELQLKRKKLQAEVPRLQPNIQLNQS
jgi:hypothetical protein